jgi:hypothetical protein
MRWKIWGRGRHGRKHYRWSWILALTLVIILHGIIPQSKPCSHVNINLIERQTCVAATRHWGQPAMHGRVASRYGAEYQNNQVKSTPCSYKHQAQYHDTSRINRTTHKREETILIAIGIEGVSYSHPFNSHSTSTLRAVRYANVRYGIQNPIYP